ncbi:hypothetical protein LEP1GSC166_3282 [Leptospira kirschneri]|nr:hypothetical protein LEP1GSC166_3282 [Leptospira kirschneri]
MNKPPKNSLLNSNRLILFFEGLGLFYFIKVFCVWVSDTL